MTCATSRGVEVRFIAVVSPKAAVVGTIISTALDVVIGPGQTAFTRTFESAGSARADVDVERERLVAAHAGTVRVLTAALARAQATGEVTSSASPEAQAQALLCLFQGYAVVTRAGVGPATLTAGSRPRSRACGRRWRRCSFALHGLPSAVAVYEPSVLITRSNTSLSPRTR
jgi:hypothetical protein